MSEPDFVTGIPRIAFDFVSLEQTVDLAKRFDKKFVGRDLFGPLPSGRADEDGADPLSCRWSPFVGDRYGWPERMREDAR